MVIRAPYARPSYREKFELSKATSTLGHDARIYALQPVWLGGRDPDGVDAFHWLSPPRLHPALGSAVYPLGVDEAL